MKDEQAAGGAARDSFLGGVGQTRGGSSKSVSNRERPAFQQKNSVSEEGAEKLLMITQMPVLDVVRGEAGRQKSVS